MRCLLSIETEIVETGTQFYGIRRYTRPARKVVKEKENRQNAKKIGRCHAVPMGLNPMLHRSICHCTLRIQDALGIKVKVTSVFLQTGLRIKYREESLSLSLSVPLFGHVRNADDDTNSSRAFGYIARACIEQYLGT